MAPRGFEPTTSPLLTLERHHDEDGADADEAGPAHLGIEQVGDDEREQRVEPQMVEEDGHDVEAAHVVAQQVHHLARRALPQRGAAQPRGLRTQRVASWVMICGRPDRQTSEIEIPRRNQVESKLYRSELRPAGRVRLHLSHEP